MQKKSASIVTMIGNYGNKRMVNSGNYCSSVGQNAEEILHSFFSTGMAMPEIPPFSKSAFQWGKFIIHFAGDVPTNFLFDY